MLRQAPAGARGLVVGPMLVLTILASGCGSPTRHPASGPATIQSSQAGAASTSNSAPIEHSPPKPVAGARNGAAASTSNSAPIEHSPSTGSEPSTAPAASTSNSAPIEHSPSTGSEPSTAAAAPPRPDPGGFALVVKTDAGDLPAQVAPMNVASHQLVDPPHDTPQQWNTAAWIVQAAYPAVRSTGTTYIYGHACHHHICPFTDLKQAKLADPVIITTPTATITYLIRRIGLSPKSASSLPDWASDSTIKDRLVLVTCQFENGDDSTNNIVIVAELSS